ncbi:hypothetical protein C7H19_10240 [Aphanothece hegewaldii CCALA 016]|uniref:DUF1830 domain-containing protein n=1 Tax=Aphanothece hegewaldii CCALA 016 TaxID=2107694 RepID=A0A2T1LYR7_9CHRO|nr:DUF1830 domain-containing protein [Aphanothece hegewaldii]PSF37535.1 hypothetical protein C7H19_10240 [Aphanothece hegewaldii CCALA 016]
MAQILDPLPNDQKKSILCCYVNATSHIQVVRISNMANWYFERVVFPGQRLVFEALPESLLEIHTGMMCSAILSDTIPCERLSIDDDDDDELRVEPIAKSEQSKTHNGKSDSNKSEQTAGSTINHHFKAVLASAT